jgi:O-glycosyl hydrolase
MLVRLAVLSAITLAMFPAIPAAAAPATALTSAAPAGATQAAAAAESAATQAATADQAATATQAAAASQTTVTIDPSYQQPAFQGWGTSLAWLAEATGDYPDEIRNKLVDLLFGADGLNLNIARFNVGGGNAPTVNDYLRPGGAVPGFWRAPQQYGPTDKDWWNPDDPAHWNLDADPNQRWWVDQVKDTVTRWEAFSNSPPYFQTVSGYVSGGFSATTDQIRSDKTADFAKYLTRAVDHLEAAHDITFDTIDPLNEPNTDYWRTTLNSSGQPTGGRQEGAHAGPALQAQVIEALQRELTATNSASKIAAPDETNPGTFLQDWYGYPATAQAAVSQLNVHTYGTGQRTAARDVAKAEQKPLWMSEVEGSWGNDFTSMNSGLGMAQRIIDDFRELEPSAWVLWQPVEDLDNMIAEGNLQWGSIHVPFDCGPTDTLTTCPIKTNTKFDTVRNFTHYIRPGDRVVKVSDAATLAAIRSDGTGVTAVHSNPTTQPRAVTLDMTKFRAADGTVTPVVTSAAGKLVRQPAVRIVNKRATMTVPAESVTTFVINGATGVSANHISAGSAYRIQGLHSGLSLAPAGGNAAIRTTDNASAEQLWRLSAAGNGLSSRERYAVTNAGNGQRLAVRNGSVVTEAASGSVDEGAQWVVSTTGDGTYTLVSVAARRVIDVPGEATADGTAVGLWQPTSRGNQRWTLRDETVVGTERTEAYTIPGLTPQLPATVTATLAGGASRDLPVSWKPQPARKWAKPGTVTVRGTATDVLGNRIKATAKVVVDVFRKTLPATATTYPGAAPTLPPTVTGIGRHGGRASLPVTWDAAPDGAFDKLGKVTLGGTAHVVDGSTIPARVTVEVVAATEENAGLGASVTATYTEPGYATDGLTNGVTTDKAWSNWKSSGRNASETLTVTLAAPRDVTRVVVHFYPDNSSGGGIAESVRAGVSAADGSCAGTDIAQPAHRQDLRHPHRHPGRLPDRLRAGSDRQNSDLTPRTAT